MTKPCIILFALRPSSFVIKFVVVKHKDIWAAHASTLGANGHLCSDKFLLVYQDAIAVYIPDISIIAMDTLRVMYGAVDFINFILVKSRLFKMPVDV